MLKINEVLSFENSLFRVLTILPYSVIWISLDLENAFPIEVNRSQYKIDEKSLEQAYEYQAFIKEKYATDTSISNVVCYIIGGTKKDDFKTRNKLSTYQKSGEVFAKTYEELLQQSKTYHKEFIDKHKELNS